jgi:hypothetical protein
MTRQVTAADQAKASGATAITQQINIMQWKQHEENIKRIQHLEFQLQSKTQEIEQKDAEFKGLKRKNSSAERRLSAKKAVCPGAKAVL